MIFIRFVTSKPKVNDLDLRIRTVVYEKEILEKKGGQLVIGSKITRLNEPLVLGHGEQCFLNA